MKAKRKDGIYASKAWREVRLLVLMRDGHKCQIVPGCTRKADCVDHIISWREGGAWYDMANLRAGCTHHNAQRVKRPGGPPPKRRPSRDW